MSGPAEQPETLRLTPEAWAEFLALLNAPAEPNAALRRLLSRPAPWERGA